MKYEWKKTIFKPEDFDGAGQYIVRETINKENYPHIMDTEYLSTVMMKVGYNLGTRRSDRQNNMYCLVDMSDGLVREGYFTNTKTDEGKAIDTEKWIWNPFAGTTGYEAKTRLCEYLNDNPHGETYRFATNEEVVRVIMCQRGNRTKG
jgi:hypothetical protein